MNILIFEDEIPAHEKLLGFIHAEIEEAQIIGWARSIQEARLLLQRKQQPDLIFSDIELLDGVSFKVFEEIKVTCPIIFCTAFDQYVLQAFKTNGIAYLLKPYNLDNFREAFDKYRLLFNKQEEQQQLDDQVLKELKDLLHASEKSYKQRFIIKKKEGIKLIETREIMCFEANGDFCFAYDAKGHKHVINQGLSQVEEKINPGKFFRINRSQIINIDFVEKIEPHFKNKLSVKMNHLPETLLTSANKTPEFRKWLEG
ncbi:MAG: LytTR family DNA-binding domain-containing protein [Bacteroidota bacterium]